MRKSLYNTGESKISTYILCTFTFLALLAALRDFHKGDNNIKLTLDAI
jgi:hypothetical protein